MHEYPLIVFFIEFFYGGTQGLQPKKALKDENHLPVSCASYLDF